jgi:hypothetical protein
MRKIKAILISLLFVASIFGVAQTMAQEDYCGTDYYTISRDSVKVGETFTISLSTEYWEEYDQVKIAGLTIQEITLKIIENSGLPYRIGSVEMIGVDYYGEEGALIYSGLVLPTAANGFPGWDELDPSWPAVKTVTWTFRAVSPGKLILTNDECEITETITVTPKSLPIFRILQILKKNRCKNHPDLEGCNVN